MPKKRPSRRRHREAREDGPREEQGDLLADAEPRVRESGEDAGEGGTGEPEDAVAPRAAEGAEPAHEADSAAGGETDVPPAPSKTDVADDAPAPAPAGEALARARDLVTEGRLDEAVRVYGEILEQNPDHVKARNNLGVLFDEAGRHEAALEQFLAARAVEPENVEVVANLGAALASVGRFEEAEKELRRAQRIAPDSVAVRASLGILFFRRGLYAQAEGELRWVCERDSSHGPAHYYRGEALNRLGRVEPAMEALERAIELQPRNARAYYTLGILYDRMHLPGEAAAMYRKSREVEAS